MYISIYRIDRKTDPGRICLNHPLHHYRHGGIVLVKPLFMTIGNCTVMPQRKETLLNFIFNVFLAHAI